MVSLRAQLANRYLRLTMKRMPLHLMEAPALRAYFEARRIPALHKGVTIEVVNEPGVAGEWHRPVAGGDGGVIFYMHGGGYIFGSAGLYRSMTTAMAAIAGADLFSLDYRRAPEHPCPAAIDDALAAYDWLLKKGIAADRIVIGGDSAGGGLALSVLQALRDSGRTMPAGAALFSPWTDLAATGRSVRDNSKSDCMFQEVSIRECGKRYAGRLDLKDPRVSPLYGGFRGLPPLLVLVSADEMLFDDSRRLVEKARNAGVDVQFEQRGGLSHVWPLFYPLYPEAKEAMMITGDFVRARTGATKRIAA